MTSKAKREAEIKDLLYKNKKLSLVALGSPKLFKLRLVNELAKIPENFLSYDFNFKIYQKSLEPKVRDLNTFVCKAEYANVK